MPVMQSNPGETKMVTLLERVQAIASQAKVPKLIEQNLNTKVQVSFQVLTRKAQTLREHLIMYQGLRVGIAVTPSEHGISALMALDGVAGQLVLFAQDQQVEQLSQAELDIFIDATGRLHQLGNSLTKIKGYSEQTQWGLFTSGTTGQPKLQFHTLDKLCRTVKSPTPHSGEFRWGLTFELNRFAGLQVLFQALCGGSDIVLTPSAAVAERMQMFHRAGVNALSATPSMWRQLLMLPDIQKWTLRQITIGGEIADQALLDRLRYWCPGARVIHIYASTEAGVGFSVNDSKAGFPQAWITDGIPAGGQLKVENDELFIRPLGQTSFVATGDAVYQEQGRVYFAGRLSGVINVGGNKVHPEFIEQKLASIAGIQSLKAYPSKNTMLGALVGIEVVADTGADIAELKLQIQQHAKCMLEPWQRPARITFVKQLAVSGSGKLVRSH